ncbi:hypothetical protein BSKO_10905 [Bryopsis sp. KO-2023]|nr:hypothetical protein BSKO_10905 [Bryopsis sp. KO-2023]
MTTVYVSPLPEDVSEAELSELLEEVGGIRSLKILGKGGPAVCDFFDPAAAGVARRNLDGNEWQDVVLEVRYTYELTPEQRQPIKKPSGDPVEGNGDLMEVENPAPAATEGKENFESESAVKRIMENLPGLNVDIETEGAVSSACAKLGPKELMEVLYAAQDAAMINGKALKEIMVAHPDLTRALFEAQLNQDMLKVPDNQGVEVESLMQQLLSMLKPKKVQKDEEKQKSKPTGHFSRDGSSAQTAAPRRLPRGPSRHPRNTVLPTLPSNRAPRHRSYPHRHHPTPAQPKNPAFASATAMQPAQLTHQTIPFSSGVHWGNGGVMGGANIQVPQQMQGLAQQMSAQARRQLTQSQFPGQIALQTPLQQQQLAQLQGTQGAAGVGLTGMGSIGNNPLQGMLGGAEGGGLVLNPSAQQQQVAQLNAQMPNQQGVSQLFQQQAQSMLQLQGGMVANQSNLQGNAGQGTWQPHDLSAIPPPRPPPRPPPMDSTSMYVQRGVSNPYGSIASSQSTQQGWIVRPQMIPQQQQMMVGSGQGLGMAFANAVQPQQGVIAAQPQAQPLTNDTTSAGQIAGGWMGGRSTSTAWEGRFGNDSARGGGRTGRGRVWYR